MLRASQDADGQACATAPLWGTLLGRGGFVRLEVPLYARLLMRARCRRAASGVTDEQALLLRYREECSAVCKGARRAVVQLRCSSCSRLARVLRAAC